ncbi:NAD(P)-dependent alcohol dehydrogenase [Zunongwangia sp. HGR-M22]|uniref:NAD(P)-dependent alcohol dehydrogenase n=1 Tax=Zunongwangia sp. HGR-M22 TaxID=3015168 RepID=UPI0022DDE303|nr:NAD(P)-dependent alcohol dehydrogenase [Zunongwangia sp. HGR-M22]WBL24300.1 NAD(P)-dependent alcohol dehydrogenase [Zunongwangia sp. HGR-M22]
MKKVIFNEYGGVEVLQLVESEIPILEKNTILIKVKAVSINPLDWKIRNGEMKIMTGSKLPKGVGIDFSGVVETLNIATTKFKKGDEIFGSLNAMQGGALAEYLLVREDDIHLKPSNLTFEEAAAIPIVGSAALQIFDKLIKLKSDSEILINGASGGIGMFAVQMAKRLGANVTAVSSSKGIALLEKWQVDHIVDYTQNNILDKEQRFDVVIDFSDKLPFDKAKILMKPKSIYINTIPSPVQMISSFFHNIFSRKKIKILFSKPTPGYLRQLASFTEQGMDVVIGKKYPISDYKLAYAEVPNHSILGKAVFILE